MESKKKDLSLEEEFHLHELLIRADALHSAMCELQMEDHGEVWRYRWREYVIPLLEEEYERVSSEFEAEARRLGWRR